LDLKESSFIASSTKAVGTDLNGDGQLDDLTSGGGNILIRVQDLRVIEGATITSSTALGETLAVAGGMVTVEGLEGSKPGSVLLSGQSSGIVSASAAGVPGDLTVNTGTLTITNGAVISTGSAQSGPAGNVGITADSIAISAGGQIFSRSAARDAGQVTITANNALTLDNGSIVTSTTSESLGRGGNVELNVIGTVSLTNGASINSQSEIFSNGRAGDITITGRSLTMANQAEISSSSLGNRADAGDAGNITIQSGSTVLLKDSSITTEAREASGGQIEINAPEMIQLTNSRISTSVRDGTGGGGNITIDPQFVILQNSQIIAQAFAGAGGAITITAASAYIKDPLSIVNASSTLGISGTVNIQSPLQNVGGELTALTQEFSSAAALLAQQCAARAAGGTFSTFVVAGREGLPAEPGGFLASPSLTPELLGPSLSLRDPQSQFPAITGLFPKYDAKPIQLAKLGNACR
jgi:large exoprotein involved in heme utilization and adhesion